MVGVAENCAIWPNKLAWKLDCAIHVTAHMMLEGLILESAL